MARRGRTGRLPRSAPSLTNTIVAIAREMQRQRDENIMSAWKSGGMFEGQKVTDELILKHWKSRLAGVAKDDPLYDMYKNAVTQYEYAIAESKMTAGYAQGNVSDSQAAAFYINWSKKIPKDSEFYRQLLRDAGRYTAASRARADNSVNIAKENAYQARQNAAYTKNEAPAFFLLDVLNGISESKGFITSDKPNILTGFQGDDPGAILAFLQGIEDRSDPAEAGTAFASRSKGDATVVTVKGKRMTMGEIKKQLGIEGPLTMAVVRKVFDTAAKSQDNRYNDASRTGHATDVKKIQDAQTWIDESKRQTGIWPVKESYDAARRDRDRILSNDTATFKEKTAAWDTYNLRLLNLGKTPGLDQNTISRLNAEATGDASIDTLFESWNGYGNAAHLSEDGQYVGDTASAVQQREALEFGIQLVESGQGRYAFGSYQGEGANRVFKAGPGGTVLGVVDNRGVPRTAKEQTLILERPGQLPIEVAVQPKPITGAVIDTNGNSYNLETPNSNILGWAYDVVIDGVPVRRYSSSETGGPPYSTSFPGITNAVPGLSIVDGATDIVVTRTIDPISAADPNNGIKTNDGGKTFTVDPQLVIAKGQPPAVPFNPATDSYSFTMSAYSGTAEGLQHIRNIEQDPTYGSTFSREISLGAGMVPEMGPDGLPTGNLIPGANFDQDALDRGFRALGVATNAPGFDINNVITQFDRKPPTAAQMKNQRGMVRLGVQGPLPIDSLRGAADRHDFDAGNGFSSITLGINVGTNELSTDLSPSRGDPRDRAFGGPSLKVPGMPLNYVGPKTINAPSGVGGMTVATTPVTIPNMPSLNMPAFSPGSGTAYTGGSTGGAIPNGAR